MENASARPLTQCEQHRKSGDELAGDISRDHDATGHVGLELIVDAFSQLQDVSRQRVLVMKNLALRFANLTR